MGEQKSSALVFSLKSRPRLLYPWILRDDGDNLLLYKCSTDELRYLVLSPAQALIIPFFSGERTYEEIQSIWLYLVKSSDRTEDLDFLNSMLYNLTSPDKIIGISGEPSYSLKDKTKIPIPDFKNYRWPAERTSLPISVMVSLTNRCAADCLYCYAERKPCEELNLNEWKIIFDKLSGNSIYLVDLSGGDVFARKDIFEILQEMAAREFIFFISTKSYVSPSKALQLASLGIGINNPKVPFRDMQVSVDSIINKVASSLTNIKDYLPRAKATTKNLIAAGMNPRIKCVLTPYNWMEIEDIIKVFSELGVRRFHFVQYGRSLYRHSDNFFLTKEQKLYIHNIVPELKNKYKELEIECQDDIPAAKPSIEEWNSRAICTGGRSSMIILPNGDVTLCEQLPHSPEYVVGNLLSQSLPDIWNGTAVESLLHPPREKFSGTACFVCADFDECHTRKGYCYRDSLSAFGNFYDAPPNCPKQDKIPLRLI